MIDGSACKSLAELNSLIDSTVSMEDWIRKMPSGLLINQRLHKEIKKLLKFRYNINEQLYRSIPYQVIKETT